MAGESNTESNGPGGAQGVTVIGSNVVVEDGRLVVVNDLVVYGNVDANIVAGGRVVVAAGGIVTGRIEADSVAIAGLVRGEVDARNSFSLEESGELYGRAAAKRFAVAPGSAGEFQLTMHRETLGFDREKLAESRRRYEEALKAASALVGSSLEPSRGYSKWYRRQVGDVADDLESEVSVASGDDDRGNSPAGRDEEIVIDWPPASVEDLANRKRFASGEAVGRFAWSKSIGDELTRKNVDHLVLSADELESIGGENLDEIDTDAEPAGGSTDDLINSPILREALDSVRNESNKGSSGKL